MAIDQALRDLMQDSVTIEPYSGTNVNRESTYSSGTAYTCRVVGKRAVVRRPDGTEAVSMARAYLDQVVAVDPRSRITLPSRFTPQQPAILSVETHPDEDGTSGTGAHTVVYV